MRFIRLLLVLVILGMSLAGEAAAADEAFKITVSISHRGRYGKPLDNKITMSEGDFHPF